MISLAFAEQDELVKANSYNDSIEDMDELKQSLRARAKKILDDVFDKEGVNIIAASGDSSLCIHSAAAGKEYHLEQTLCTVAHYLAGYPIATVPISSLKYNGRPFGLCLVAREHHEYALLHFMTAYELISGPRPVPVL